MNKTELIAKIAEKADFSKKDAEKALNAFVDSVKDAVGGFAKEPPKMLLVEYKDDTKAQLLKLGENEFLAIEQSLRQDPRPAYKEKEQDTKIYQARLYEMVISFVVKENTLQVIKVEHA